MRVYEPNTSYRLVAKKPHKRHRLVKLLVITVLFVFTSLSVVSYLLPIPDLSAQVFTVSPKAQPTSIQWPGYGQAAIAQDTGGLLAETTNQKPAPTASVAKVILALAILKKYPLAPDQLGQQITITKADEAIYDHYFAENGSVVEVKAGQKIYLYHALEAVLMASANNLADTLARDIFGSVDNYVEYANQLVANMGLINTTVADASGFNPKTIATSHDLVLLGQAALKNLVIAKISSQKEVTLPSLGKIDNRNLLIGQKGIIGIKTGNTVQAGGCYLFARQRVVFGRKVTLIGAIMGAKNSEQAMADSLKLTDSIFASMKDQKLINANQKIGYFELPWGGQVPIVAKSDVTTFGYVGKPANIAITIKSYAASQKTGDSVGDLQVNNVTKSQAVLAVDIPQPSKTWRAFRWL